MHERTTRTPRDRQTSRSHNTPRDPARRIREEDSSSRAESSPRARAAFFRGRRGEFHVEVVSFSRKAVFTSTTFKYYTGLIEKSKTHFYGPRSGLSGSFSVPIKVTITSLSALLRAPQKLFSRIISLLYTVVSFVYPLHIQNTNGYPELEWIRQGYAFANTAGRCSVSPNISIRERYEK